MLTFGRRGRTGQPATRWREPFGARDPRRFQFIDDLRGIAAVAVVASHLLDRAPLLPAVSEHGRHGVEIFFVISGFVMAHSIGDRAVSPGFAGRFLLRRSIRLDPAYWVVMVITLLVWAAIGWQPLDGPGDVAVNAVYLQELTGTTPVVSVAWTLALELQFYLCFVALLGLCQLVARPGWPASRLRIGVFVGTGLGSAAVYSLWMVHPALESLANVPGLFTAYWFMFVLGVLVQWTNLRGLHPAVLLGFVATVTVVDVVARPGALVPADDLSALVAVGTAVVVHLAARGPLLRRGLGIATVAYLGVVSYSLYLIHPIVGQTVIERTFWRFGGGPVVEVGATVLGIGLSVAAAHVLYVLVEAPTVRLSRRIRADPAPSRPVGSGVGAGAR